MRIARPLSACTSPEAPRAPPRQITPPNPPPAASLHLHPSSLSLTSPSFFPSFSLQPAVDSIDLTGEDILFTQNIPREAPQRSPTRDQSVPDDNDRAPEVEVGQLYSDRAAVMRGIADFAHRTNKEFVCDPLVRGGSGFKMRCRCYYKPLLLQTALAPSPHPAPAYNRPRPRTSKISFQFRVGGGKWAG